MKFATAALGLLVLCGSALAQAPGQLTTLAVVRETPMGAFKVVEGLCDAQPATTVTVWVNGFSTRCSSDAHFKILIPNEPIALVVGFQSGTNVEVTLNGREALRTREFEALNSANEDIRDLLRKPGKPSAVAPAPAQGSADDIRDLLRKPKTSATAPAQGSDDDIRDLLRKPKASAVAPAPAQRSADDIRDLLRTPPQKPAPAPVPAPGASDDIRDLLRQPPR